MFFGCVKSSRSSLWPGWESPEAADIPRAGNSSPRPSLDVACRAQERKLLNTIPAARETEGPARPLLSFPTPAQFRLCSLVTRRAEFAKQSNRNPILTVILCIS